MERQLKESKILETAEKLRARIAQIFPDSGLSGVATELCQVTREAMARAATIRQPNYWFRAALVVIGVLAAVGLARYFVLSPDLRTGANDFMEFLQRTYGAGIYLIAAAAFFVNLEIRYKRRKALRAVHELRSMAHLIDMHQLSKAPERVGSNDGPRMEQGRLMTREEVGRYLHFCTELLAIVSKIGQLYVQDFPDAPATTAVDHCEGLATGLSNKIWQKIMILDTISNENCSPAVRDPAAPAST